MINEAVKGSVSFLMIIAERKQREKLIASLYEEGAHCLHISYGKGSVESSYIMDVLGLVHEENKAIITCIFKNDRLDSVFEMLNEKYDFNKPNTGIAYTIPVETVAF